MKPVRPLPALIEGWIKTLRDPTINIFIRDNHCAMLENVRDAADEAIKMFYDEKNRVLSKQKA